MKNKTNTNSAIEAEVITENTKAPLLKDIEYPVTVVNLTNLLEEYKDIPNINPESENAKAEYAVVTKGYKAFVKARNSIERARKDLKRPSIDYGKNVDHIASDLQSKINPTEALLLAEKEKFENHERLKRQREEEQEQARKDEIKGRIETIKNLSLCHIKSNSNVLADLISSIEIPNEEDFQEYTVQAVEAYKLSMQNLESMYETKQKAEQADIIEAQRLERLEEEEAQRLAQVEAERAEFEAEKEAFRLLQAEQKKSLQMMQENINRQNAEREAEELQKKQDEEAKQRAEQEKEAYARCYKESLDDLEILDALDSKKLLDAIIEGNIKNIYWKVN